MTISKLLRAALAANGGVAAIVGARIYPVFLPQNPTYEAITYQRISNSATNGSTALRESRYQIDCWAQSYSEAQALASAVKTAMEEWGDVSETPGVKMTRVIGELDDYDPDVDVWRTIIDVMLTTTGD